MNCGLLWNTYGGDIEWFKFSARSYSKFARGFSAAKCVVPNPDVPAFRPICEANGIHLVGFDEWPEKGFNHHQFLQCYGDAHFPQADAIFHIDADCVFGSECSPSDWIIGGKILLPFVDFANFLTRPVYPGEAMDFMGFHGLRSDFNRGCYWWKFATDVAVGWPVIRECMQWMPIVHYREVYPKVREVVASQHGVSFEEYVKGCRNSFPQSFCEFNTLGAIAHKFFQEQYIWHDIRSHGYPFAGKIVQCHSHSGFEKPHAFPGEVGGFQTPRQLFERLGL